MYNHYKTINILQINIRFVMITKPSLLLKNTEKKFRHMIDHFLKNKKSQKWENCFFIGFRTLRIFLDQKPNMATLVCMLLTRTGPIYELIALLFPLYSGSEVLEGIWYQTHLVVLNFCLERLYLVRVRSNRWCQ